MICLGIESTAHTFGIGIVDENCNILSNEKDSFVSKKGGMIPRNLFDHHIENANKVLQQALEVSNVKLEEIDFVAFSQGPGIGQALRTGSVFARALSLKLNKPLVPVNHCIAHIEIGRKKCNLNDPITLYASGANTQVIGFESGKYRVYGETLDIGIGNLLDSFGRKLGLGFPAGPKMSELYYKANKLIELPYTVKGMDLSFSGLQTSAENKIGKESKEDLIFSLMQNAFSMLTEVTERVLAHTEKQELLAVGGVACSKPLQEMLSKMCKDRNCVFKVPENQFLVDNPAQIAWLGILTYNSGIKNKLSETIILPSQRTDQVIVKWR